MTALYAWGANSHGQLGLGFVSDQVLAPVRVDELPDNLCEPTIEFVAGGGGHSFLLTSNGRLYGAGLNMSGQIGDGTQARSVPCFQPIRGLEGHHIVGVACGWAHSVGFSKTGHVWVWGCNNHGQLGLPTNEVPFTSLPICLDIENVVSVGAGLRHTAAVTQDGSIYTWGQGNRGQLGHVDDDSQMVKSQPTPRVVNHEEGKIKSVVCGQNTTYALTVEGHVLAWGDNKWGQLAHNPRNVSFFTCPLMIPHNYFGGERVLWLRAGWTHCVAAVVSGSVYMWGRADYGQLGPDEDECCQGSPLKHREFQASSPNNSRCRYVPNCLMLDKSIRNVVCGSEHNLALVGSTNEDLALYTWGWNEHGNCGVKSTANVESAVKVNLPGNVQVIGAGSGHSFALVKIL